MLSGPFSKWAKINRIAVDSRSRNVLLKLALRRYNYPGFLLARGLFSRFGPVTVTVSLKANGTGRPMRITLRPGEMGDIASLFENWVEFSSPCDYPDGGPRLVVDAGANIGCYSLHMASLHPECEFVVFEPVPENLELLRGNLERNSVNAQISGSALWHKDVDCLFMVPAAANAGYATEDSQTGCVCVAGQTLKSVVGDRFDNIGLVKLDIEGAEWSVLPDLLKTLPPQCLVWMELHEPSRNPGWLDQQLKDNGWRGVKKESAALHEMWILQRH